MSFDDETTRGTDDEAEATYRRLMEAPADGGEDNWPRAHHFYWDKAQEAYWDIRTGNLHKLPKTVDGSVPRALWPMMDVPLDDRAAQREIRMERELRHAGQRGRPTADQQAEDAAALQRMMDAAGGEGHIRMRVTPTTFIGNPNNGQQVDNSTWWPGKPRIIDEGIYVGPEGVVREPGVKLFNTWLEPTHLRTGSAAEAGPWVDHIKRLWPRPEEHNYFFGWCAHMIQKPQEKCNTVIVLSGAQGIGKDTALVPLKYAVGNQNFKNISPDAVFSQFKPWLRSQLVVIDEVRPYVEEHKAAGFYEALKEIMGNAVSDGDEFPPTIAMNNKNRQIVYVINVARVVCTTNDYLAMVLPADDRRVMIMHSERPGARDDPEHAAYFARFTAWIAAGGSAHVLAYLQAYDLSQFDAAAPPPRSNATQHVIVSLQEQDDDSVVGRRLNEVKLPKLDMIEMREIGKSPAPGKLAVPPEAYAKMRRWIEGIDEEADYDEQDEMPPVVFKKMLFARERFDADEVRKVTRQRSRFSRIMKEFGYVPRATNSKEGFVFQTGKGGNCTRIREPLVYWRKDLLDLLGEKAMLDLTDAVGKGWVTANHPK